MPADPLTAIPIFRAATSADAAAIHRLLISVGLYGPELRGIAELLEADSQLFVVGVVPDESNQVMAVAGLEVYGHHALLRSVGVGGEWAGRGLGRRLIDRVVAEAASRGVHTLYLLTYSADSFFRRVGFDLTPRDEVPGEIASTAEFRLTGERGSVAMRRTLTSA